MRLKLFVCGVTTLVPVLLLSGCGVDQTSMISANVQSGGITGRAMGGQQPVTGAVIEVVAMGTTGYGSAGTVLSQTTTDPYGNFTLPSYTCPQSNTPVYLMGIGGNAGAGTNPSALEIAALGGCAAAQKSYVIMNEVTTAVAAVAFSHYFSSTPPTGGSTAAGDSIGGPSTTSGGMVQYSRGMVFANNVTVPLLVTDFDGAVAQGGNGTTIEWQKINTIANILAACMNSSGSPNATETKTTCGKLFNYTKNGATTRPADVMQAAVQMALYPATDVSQLYALIGGTPPFVPYQTVVPNDWTIGVSYTTSTLGLAVDTGTISTLDIDSSGNIWFPSNGSGVVGVASFDPTNQTFSGPYNTTVLVHPQQVAIDANGYVWLNDTTSPAVSGYLTTSPTLTESVAFPNTTSQSLTIGGDDRVNVGITNGTKYEIANISANRLSYSLDTGVAFAFPVTSMAGDTSDGDAVGATDPSTTRMRYYSVTAPPATVTQVGAGADYAGGTVFTGNDHITVRSYVSGENNEALCIYSVATCYNFAGGLNEGAKSIAIDGGGQLWLAESGDGGVVQVPVNTPGAAGGLVYQNPNGAANITFHQFLHNGNDGEPVTAPVPYGVGVDDAGNVWVTNAGCTTSDCTPSGNFTLTEVVGAGYPTITPVSAQITSGNLVGTEPTY